MSGVLRGSGTGEVVIFQIFNRSNFRVLLLCSVFRPLNFLYEL